jgi:uncharacterized protein YqgV (UPF0045/DUF77 family)
VKSQFFYAEIIDEPSETVHKLPIKIANQSTFIKGRFIHDNFMLVQQAARFLHQQRQPRILLELDITKAFDSVHRLPLSFLIEVMQKLGFGPIWRAIICGLLGSSPLKF